MEWALFAKIGGCLRRSVTQGNDRRIPFALAAANAREGPDKQHANHSREVSWQVFRL